MTAASGLPIDGPSVDDGRSQRERMLAGDLYLADDPELAAEARRAAMLTEALNRTSVADTDSVRRRLGELLGWFGPGSELRLPLYCDYGWNISIGENVFVNHGLVALDVAPIVIGDDVLIGPGVQLLTPTHPVDPLLRRAKWEAAAPITIDENAWLGGGAIVLAGVTIGRDSVIGAGAVVTRDVAPGVVVAGNPARVIRSVS